MCTHSLSSTRALLRRTWLFNERLAHTGTKRLSCLIQQISQNLNPFQGLSSHPDVKLLYYCPLAIEQSSMRRFFSLWPQMVWYMTLFFSSFHFYLSLRQYKFERFHPWQKKKQSVKRWQFPISQWYWFRSQNFVEWDATSAQSLYELNAHSRVMCTLGARVERCRTL